MNAADHLARAEIILDTMPEPTAPEFNMLDLSLSVHALAHAVTAIAIELGVPHPNAPTGGKADAQAG